MKIFGYIYKITNQINGKVYIGCTIYSIKRRWTNHLTDANRGSPTHIHRAIRKYGADNFKVYQLNIAYSLDELYKMEIGYILEFNSFKNGMNMTEGGEGSHGFKFSEKLKNLKSEMMLGNQFALGHKHNAETLEKIREASVGNSYAKGLKHTPEFCEAISMRTKGKKNPFYGKKHSIKIKEKIRQFRLGKSSWNKGISPSLETRKKIGDGNKGKIISKETRKKLSLAGMGKKHTQESKDKMKLAKMGHIVSIETRIKISNTLKERGDCYGRTRNFSSCSISC